jgi:tetratricopeptide (TPR) repeat protein
MFRSSNPQSASFEGKDMTAEQLLLTGENKITSELNNQPDVYTEIMLAIGDALRGIDAFKEAKKSYEKALAKTSESTEPLESKVKTYVKLGRLNTYWRNSQENAYQNALEANKILEKIENPSPALEASVFGLLGRTISVRDNYEEGNSYFEKADSIYINAGLENSYDYIQMLTEYGRSLIYVSDFKKSEEILLKSNKLHREKYADPTLTIAENYKFMAWANRELGNFEKSNNYFLKSIDLKRELTGDQTVTTAISMYHLSRNYTLSGDFQKSEQLAQEVLNIYRENLEPGNQYIFQAKNYVAIARYNQNKFSEAEKLFESVIKEQRENDSDNKMFLGGVLAHLAVVYHKTGRFQEAVSLLEESIKINEKNLGSRSRGVAVDMVKLAVVYRKMEEYQKAREYFLQAESILKEETPVNHYRRAELYFKYAKLEQDMSQSQEARQYFQQAYNIYLEIFGEDNNRTTKAKSYLENIAQA